MSRKSRFAILFVSSLIYWAMHFGAGILLPDVFTGTGGVPQLIGLATLLLLIITRSWALTNLLQPQETFDLQQPRTLVVLDGFAWIMMFGGFALTDSLGLTTPELEPSSGMAATNTAAHGHWWYFALCSFAAVAAAALAWRYRQSMLTGADSQIEWTAHMQPPRQYDVARVYIAVILLIGSTFAIVLLSITDAALPHQHFHSLFTAILVGNLWSILQPHAQRQLAAVPLCVLLLILGLATWSLESTRHWQFAALGTAVGWAWQPLLASLNTLAPRRQRFAMLVVFHALPLLAGALFVIVMKAGFGNQAGGIAPYALLPMVVIGMIVVTRLFLREVMEQLIEVIMWPIYRVQGFGPGLHKIPVRGPVIVIANHAAWLDPIWLAKALPCRLTPMMTSRFFDLPLVGWVVRVLAQAIRVPDSGFRREAPEIQEALERLHQGHIVLVFPEGRMRRTEDRLLRRFGQGIYQILRDQPHIPVVACWIEGNWGTYTSFANGPPTKNKKLDRWRPIRIGISEPLIVTPELLADANRTRRFLMDACLQARGHLGLEVPTVESFVERDEDKEDNGGS